MNITDIEILRLDRFLYVRVHTDEGISGLGESGAWGYQDAAAAAAETFKRYLIGKDPLQIEHHWQVMYRSFHFRGAAIMGAISAIDIALWDIAGKYYGAPVYQLLGGKCRDMVRAYYHVKGHSMEEVTAKCIAAKQAGFTAVGHLSPFLDHPKGTPVPYTSLADKLEAAADRVRQYREAVGSEVDLCIEIHRRLSPGEAVMLAQAIEPYSPFFIEDPVKPDNFDSMAYVASRTRLPIATGERLHTIQEFAMLLRRDAVQYVRPDVCLVGGITHAKKIAALAESFDVPVVPHNPGNLSPVSTAACLHVAMSIPNLALQECPANEDVLPKSELVKRSYRIEAGHFTVDAVPGLGVELAENAVERFPMTPRNLHNTLGYDGAVVDL